MVLRLRKIMRANALLLVTGVFALAGLMGCTASLRPQSPAGATEADTIAPTPRPARTPTNTPFPTPTATITPLLPLQGDPQRFVLALTDMPAGFSADSKATGPATSASLANAAKDPAAALRRWQTLNIVGGYIVLYQKSGLAVIIGTAQVENGVLVFGNSDFAAAYYDGRADSYKQQGFVLEPVSVPVLGDKTEAFKFTETSGSGKTQIEWTTFQIVVLKRNVVADIATVSSSSTANFEDALGFARVVESRIK